MVAREKVLYRLAAVLVVAPLALGAAPTARLTQAVDIQRALVAEQPDNAGALNDLGNLLVETGQLEEAEEAYRRAMETGPSLPEPPFNLALLMAASDHPREARRLLKTLLREHPDHAWAHYQLGTLHQAAGNRSRALHSYREAFRIDPSLSDPKHNPHVLDNSLATAAMLEAFAMITTTATSQRIYVQPTRISGLLLPALTATPAESMPESEPEAAEAPIEEVVPGPGG